MAAAPADAGAAVVPDGVGAVDVAGTFDAQPATTVTMARHDSTGEILLVSVMIDPAQ